MHVNAELIIYGGTEPSAKLRIDGEKITLSKDGTFAYHFVLPDGQFHIPIEATSADGVEMRSALLSFLRMTELEGDVRKTGQPVLVGTASVAKSELLSRLLESRLRAGRLVEPDLGVDLAAVRRTRAAWGFFRDRRPELYGALTESSPGRRAPPEA